MNNRTYKAGDIVRVKTWRELRKLATEESLYGLHFIEKYACGTFRPEMVSLCGKSFKLDAKDAYNLNMGTGIFVNGWRLISGMLGRSSFANCKYIKDVITNDLLHHPFIDACQPGIDWFRYMFLEKDINARILFDRVKSLLRPRSAWSVWLDRNRHKFRILDPIPVGNQRKEARELLKITRLIQQTAEALNEREEAWLTQTRQNWSRSWTDPEA